MISARAIVSLFLISISLLMLFSVSVDAQFIEQHKGYAFENPGFLSIPGALSYDSGRHRLAIADKGRQIVYLFDLTDHSYQTLGADKELGEPAGLAFSRQGTLFIVEEKSPYILKFPYSVDQPETLKIGLSDGSIHPGKIYVKSDGGILIADNDHAAIYSIDSAGVLTGKITDKLRQPDGIMVDLSGEILVADKGVDPILVFSPRGEFERKLTRPESPTSQFSFAASGLAVDQCGWIYTLDMTREQIVTFDPTGVNRLEWAPEAPFFPEDIAIDRYNTIYVSESGSGSVRIFSRGN
jgi:sugar lactone lactonase YvrE